MAIVPNGYGGTAASVIPIAQNLIGVLAGNSPYGQSITALGGATLPNTTPSAITYVPFTPSATANFTFQATFDAKTYNIIVTWNQFGLRYYINVYDSLQNLKVSLPVIGSPDNYDISMTKGYFTTSLIYRVSSGNFEISG